MEKKYVFILIGISFLLCNCVAFLDEGLYSFHYLTQVGDWGGIILYTILFMIVPLTLFLSIKKSINTRFYISIFGFSPAVILLLLMLP